MKKIKFSQNQIEQIIKMYNEKKYSQQKIADYFQVSRTVIKRVLKENQVKIREKTHKYKGNYDIFENIDTPEKAYWLGFLAADGCNYIRENNASIILNLHRKDRKHLQKFLNFCKSDANINDYIQNAGYSNNTPMSKITLNSVKMSKDLIKKGVVPKKSLILKPPIIEEQFYLPFILGYFDGDGNISKTTQYNNFSISIQGTKEILEWIKDILKWDAPLEKRVQNDKNSFYIRCGGVQKPYTFLKQLYDSCETHLERKFLIFKELETVVLNRNV